MQDAEITVLRIESLQTPRSVWINSAIAAAMFHSLLIWWGLAAWQNRRMSHPHPAPIRIVAIPANAVTASPPTVATDDSAATSQATASNAENAASQAPSAAATSSSQNLSPGNRPLAQAPATSQAPTPVQPSTPVTPSVPQVATPPVSPSSPAGSQPATSPTPATPPASSSSPASSSPSSPATPSPPGSAVREDPVIPPATPPSNSRPGNGTTNPPSPNESTGGAIQSWWSLQQVPGGGSDIHDEIPQMPQGWQAETANLLENADCASGLITPDISIRLTIWPAIDAQGQIMQLLPWESNDSVPDPILQCVERLVPQMPPLIPARDGGAAIASDEVLLTIEIRSTP